MPGNYGRAALTQTMSAVTAACMVLRKDAFEAVGGFDETLAVAYNDVDLCLRLGPAASGMCGRRSRSSITSNRSAAVTTCTAPTSRGSLRSRRRCGTGGRGCWTPIRTTTRICRSREPTWARLPAAAPATVVAAAGELY